jgi:hypothetical protein
LRISDPAAALDFDQAAATRLWLFDLTSEDRLAAKIAVQTIGLLTGTAPPTGEAPAQEPQDVPVW